MRVLHLIQRYFPATGGAEAHLRAVSVRLTADGHQVTVATTDALDFEYFWNPAAARVREAEAVDGGVRILRFGVRHLPAAPLAYPAWRRLLWMLSTLRFFPTSLLLRLARLTPWVPALWRWLAETSEPFDLVAAMTITYEPLVEAGLWFARRRGIPFVVYPLTHLGAGPRPGADSLSRFYTMRHQVALVRAADAVVAQTPAERSFYEGHGVARQRLVVVGPGVDPADVLGGDAGRFWAGYGPPEPLVVFLGTVSFDKGAVHLVEAVRRLWRTGRRVALALAGRPTREGAVYLSRLRPEGRLLLLGPVSEAEKRDLLAAADVVAVPSRSDSFGIVYLEAWLYGKPVVGARTWGITDVVEHGQDGLLVPFGDVDALAEALATLLDDPARRQAMGCHGRAKVYREHTWDRKYPALRSLYLNLANAGK